MLFHSLNKSILECISEISLTFLNNILGNYNYNITGRLINIDTESIKLPNAKFEI